MPELTNERRYMYKALINEGLKRKQKEAGREKPYNQIEISEAIGVSQSTVSSLLNGPSPQVSYFAVMSLIQWLGISPNELAETLGLYKTKEDPPLIVVGE